MPRMSGRQFTRPQSTGLSRLGKKLAFYHKLQPKPKTIPGSKDALQLIRSALPEKAIDNSCERLPQATAGMRVSQ